MADSVLLPQVEASIKSELEAVAALSAAASKHPYYKYAPISLTYQDDHLSWNTAGLQLTYCPRFRYNFKWTRSVQDTVLTVLLDSWLGGSLVPEGKLGRLLTLQEVGELFKGAHGSSTASSLLIDFFQYLST